MTSPILLPQFKTPETKKIKKSLPKRPRLKNKTKNIFPFKTPPERKKIKKSLPKRPRLENKTKNVFPNSKRRPRLKEKLRQKFR